VELRINLVIGAVVERQEFSNSSTTCRNIIREIARFVSQQSTMDKREYVAALMTGTTLGSFVGVKLFSHSPTTKFSLSTAAEPVPRACINTKPSIQLLAEI
jgi:hypothetical protein